MDGSAELRTLTKKVARILRRVETNPGRGALLLRTDVGSLLGELKRLLRSEPAIVLEILLVLLERLPATLNELDDQEGFGASVIPDINDLLKRLLLRDPRKGRASTGAPAPKIDAADRERVVRRLFGLWLNDEDGSYQGLGEVLLDVTHGTSSERALRTSLIHHIRGLPLVFPPPRGADDDLQRVLLLADRHRAEHLLGELLARNNEHEYAILVAHDHYRRSSDALDLVLALRRAGKIDEAISWARRALASPRTFRQQRVMEALESLLAEHRPDQGRRSKKELIASFVAQPSQRAWEALKRSVVPEQWARVRKQVLTHLQKYQKAPTLLFRLYLEEGDLVEADGLVVAQPVDTEVLVAGATRIAEAQPAMAAGWYLVAAHQRAAQKRSALYPKVIEDLRRVQALAAASDQEPGFRRALARFRSRYARHRKLLTLLDDAGLP